MEDELVKHMQIVKIKKKIKFFLKKRLDNRMRFDKPTYLDY